MGAMWAGVAGGQELPNASEAIFGIDLILTLGGAQFFGLGLVRGFKTA